MNQTPPNSASNCLSVYTIFDNPTDFPGQFVARRFESRGSGVTPCEVVATGKTIEEVRSKLPEELTRLERFSEDDPNIVETWL